MTTNIQAQGKYRLYYTTQRYRMLAIDENNFYLFRHTPHGESLELSDPGHEMAELEHQGDFVLMTPQNGGELEADVMHLALRRGSDYHLFALPGGFPVEGSDAQPIVDLDQVMTREQLVRHFTVIPSGF